MRKILTIIALFASVYAHAQLVQNPLIIPSTTFASGNCLQATGPNSVATTSAPCGSGGSGGSGNVTGPTSSVVNDIAAFSTATGTGILDSGIQVSSIGLHSASQTWSGANTFSGAAAFTSATADTFAARPTFNGATPWDSANLTPSLYAPMNAPAFTGLASFAQRPTFNGATPWDSANLNPASFATLSGSNSFTGSNSFASRPTFNGATPWDSSNLNPSTFPSTVSPTFTNGSSAPVSSAPALTLTNTSNPVVGQISFYPSLPAGASNQIVQAGDSAIVFGNDTLNQGFVIGNDQVATGRPQGIRIASTGVSTINFSTTGSTTFAGVPLIGSNQQPVWYPGNLLDPLTVTIANQTFLDKSTASTVYLSQASAASAYLTQANAASTYLTQPTAASTYLSNASAAVTYLTQATALSTYAQMTGGVITGSYAFNAPAATSFRGIGIRTGNLQRWNVGSDVAESGSNSGSDLRFYAYSDTGALLGNAATVVRSTQQFQFTNTPTAPTATAGDSSTKLATTAFVANAVSVALPNNYYVTKNYEGPTTAPVLGSNAIILNHVFTKTVTCPAGFSGAQAYAANFATNTVSYTIQSAKLGTIGTLGFSALQRPGNFAVGSSPITFQPGDLLQIITGSTNDPTLGGVSLEIPCTSSN